RAFHVTGVQTCALPIYGGGGPAREPERHERGCGVRGGVDGNEAGSVVGHPGRTREAVSPGGAEGFHALRGGTVGARALHGTRERSEERRVGHEGGGQA